MLSLIFSNNSFSSSVNSRSFNLSFDVRLIRITNLKININTNDNNCDFCIRDINNGSLESSDMFNSSGEMYTDSLGLFPIVTIGAEYFKEESDNVYKVE